MVQGSNERVFRAFRHEHTICVQVFSEIFRERADDCAFDTVLCEFRIPGGKLEGEDVRRGQSRKERHGNI